MLDVCQGDQIAMLNMVEEFVRTMLVQLGSVRNAMLTDQNHLLHKGCEVIRSVARRFGAVWLTRAASQALWLHSVSLRNSNRSNSSPNPCPSPTPNSTRTRTVTIDFHA